MIISLDCRPVQQSRQSSSRKIVAGMESRQGEDISELLSIAGPKSNACQHQCELPIFASTTIMHYIDPPMSGLEGNQTTSFILIVFAAPISIGMGSRMDYSLKDQLPSKVMDSRLQ